MFTAIITTIQNPTPSVHRLVKELARCGGKLVVAGDLKGPACYGPGDGGRGESQAESNWPVEFLSLADQKNGRFKLAESLPTKHYARKNIAYLHAITEGAECLYETDDDNAPTADWNPRSEILGQDCRIVAPASPSRWINVYRYFTSENIWPRGLPLDQIRVAPPVTSPIAESRRAPIQQGLVNGSADVDAIWRLVLEREFLFEHGPSVYLEAGNWCPFNTQSTWWWPMAYPLLYIPSYCSFRMCDIWKSFIAQRCIWELGHGMAFHAPEVFQDRNPHDLMKDFRDEIPGYDKNRRIGEILEGLSLEKGESNVGRNLRHCYQALVAAAIFPEAELPLVEAWLTDGGYG